MVDTSDEWILKRTGISERRIAAEGENTSDMATKASKLAIERAGLEALDIDLVVCATVTPDYFNMPATSCVISDKLGIKNVQAFDISAACSIWSKASTTCSMDLSNSSMEEDSCSEAVATSCIEFSLFSEKNLTMFSFIRRTASSA